VASLAIALPRALPLGQEAQKSTFCEWSIVLQLNGHPECLKCRKTLWWSGGSSLQRFPNSLAGGQGVGCPLPKNPIPSLGPSGRGDSTEGRGPPPNEKCGPPSAPHFRPASLDFHLNRPVGLISLIQLNIVAPHIPAGIVDPPLAPPPSG